MSWKMGWEDRLENLKEGLSGVKESIRVFVSDGGIYWAILLAVGVSLLIYLLWNHAVYLRRKARYSTSRKGHNLSRKAIEWVNLFKYSRLCAEALTKRISIYTVYDYDKNYLLSSCILLTFSVFAVLYFLITVVGRFYVWYMALFYFLLFFGLFFLGGYLFSISAVISFKKKLPRTLKILNSRYLTQGDILSALYTSLDDFDPGVRKEMKKIHDILHSNNLVDINRTFSLLESTYNEEHFTLMLNLIRHAYFKGEGQDENGREVIKAQFEKTTEAILDDLENTKDLQVFSRSYVLFALFLPLLFWGGKKFNEKSLGDAAVEYFKSPVGMQVELLFFFVLVLYILYILYLERIS